MNKYSILKLGDIMTHKDLIDLNFYERSNCIAFLKAKTKYDIDKFKKYTFPLKQLTAITCRVRNDLITAIKEIMTLEKEKSVQHPHTQEELENMLYEDLRTIRRNLRKLKVVQMELALPEVVKKATIIVKSQPEPNFEPEDIVFITDEEGYKMFGEEYESYTVQELHNKGYRREIGYGIHSKPKELKLKDEIRDQLITFINQLDKTRNIEDLYLCSLEELREIYEALTQHYETLPTYEDISMSTKMGL